jgi:membrane protein required for colicin V production
MTEFAVIDIVLLALLILLTIRGFIRGFVGEFFSLGGPALGVLGAFLFYKNGGEFLRTRYFNGMKGIPEVLAFIAIFLIVFLACKIIQKIVSDVVSGMNLSTLDKVLGALFGLVEGLLAASLMLIIIRIQPLFDSSAMLQGSFFANVILPMVIETSEGVIGYPVVQIFLPQVQPGQLG